METNPGTDLWNWLVQGFIQFVSAFAEFLFSFFRQALAAFLF